MTNCPNCGAPFTGGKCAHCGAERPEFREVVERIDEQARRIVDRAAFAEWVLWVGSFILAAAVLAALLIYLI